MEKDELVLKNSIKQVRKEKSLSQRELAEIAGVSRNTISSIETGQFNPTSIGIRLLLVSIMLY